MSADDVPRHVRIEEDGHALASAEVTCTHDSANGDTVNAALHVEPGHLPAGTRGRLVDAVLDLPESQNADHLSASAPTGDGELLDRIRGRADNVRTRATGSTVLVSAELPHHPHP